MLRIIEAHNDRLKNNKDTSTHFCKINNAKLVNGIFNELLWNILKRNTHKKIISKFSNIYVTYVKNKKDRSYPRTSNTPFTKWYIKGYANQSKYFRMTIKRME